MTARNPPEPHKLPGCTCPYLWQGLGILYGVSMGTGWVRMSDGDACPWHPGPPPVKHTNGCALLQSGCGCPGWVAYREQYGAYWDAYFAHRRASLASRSDR